MPLLLRYVSKGTFCKVQYFNLPSRNNAGVGGERRPESRRSVLSCILGGRRRVRRKRNPKFSKSSRVKGPLAFCTGAKRQLQRGGAKKCHLWERRRESGEGKHRGKNLKSQGPSIKDVRIEGGWLISRHGKGGCVNLVL